MPRASAPSCSRSPRHSPGDSTFRGTVESPSPYNWLPSMPRRRSVAGGALIAAGMLLTAGQLAAQQPPHWRFFTSSDGLRESWVLDVTPGSNGRWWISHGNVDSLTVFDGYTIRQLPSPGATVAVREGPTGQLWSLLPHPTVLD